MKIQLKYGEEDVQFDLDDANVAWVASPKSQEISKPPEELIAAAIDNPIAGRDWRICSRTFKGHLVLLVDDNTRSTPQRIILPILLDKLNGAGVPDSSISALICTARIAR